MQLSCRDARMSDVDLLWRWANDAETRRNAFRKGPIPYDDHVDWLRRRLESETTRIWVFRDGDVPVGQVRFDLSGDVAEISIAVAPEQRGRGYGTAMLAEVIRRFGANHRKLRLRARVLGHNERSLRMFGACGFAAVEVLENPGQERVVVLERAHRHPGARPVPGAVGEE